MELLRSKNKPTIEYFVEQFRQIKDISDEDITDIYKYLAFMKTREENETSSNINNHLTTQWYDSLIESDDNPDYSVYADENYYKGVLACFIVYSREYIKRIATVKKDLNDSLADYIKRTTCGNILDLGNGIGFSTVWLKELFPDHDVYGTNYKDSEQWKFNALLSKKHNYTLIEDHTKLKNADVIFASEYFEHIQNPFEHLKEIVDTLDPKVLLIANSFNKDEAGHFRNYHDAGNIIPENKASRLFNKRLFDMGYERSIFRYWNNTPQVFVKKTS